MFLNLIGPFIFSPSFENNIKQRILSAQSDASWDYQRTGSRDGKKVSHMNGVLNDQGPLAKWIKDIPQLIIVVIM